jgi:hypothetical protein
VDYYITNITTTGFDIAFTNAPVAGLPATNFQIAYQVTAQPA